MIRSQAILPIRFYSDRHDQDRFHRLIQKPCKSMLNYPTNGLPSFQITREQALTTPDSFWLKNVCNDSPTYEKIVPEQASNFGNPGTYEFFGPMLCDGIYDNGVDPPNGFIEHPFAASDCGRLIGNADMQFRTLTSGVPFIEIPTSGSWHTLKIIVDKFVNNGSFSIQIVNGASLIDTITSTGVFTYYFIPSGSTVKISFDNYEGAANAFELSYIQLVKEVLFPYYDTDLQLSIGDLQIFTTRDDRDIITWCNAADYNPSPGEYYYLIRFSDGTYMYSEVFNILTNKDIENFYKLTWWHDSDLNGDVIFDEETLSCEYRNVLYLDAELFKPEYDTTTESVKNGENDEVPTFRKWQKSITLLVVRCPEFLADVLSSIFLHDNIRLREPLRNKQVIQSEDVEVLSVIGEIQPTLDDAYQKAELKLLLSEKHTITNCPEPADIITCDNMYAYQAADDPGDADYYLSFGGSEEDDGLFDHATNTKQEPGPNDLIYDVDDNKVYTLIQDEDGIWSIANTYPDITSVNVSGSNYVYVGRGIPYTYISLQYSINFLSFNEVGKVKVDGNGDFTITIPFSEHSGAATLSARAVNVNRECEFGTSDVELIF